MRLAIALGKRALASGNPPVGAIMVCNDQIIGEGIESGKSTNDITNHAEILSIRDAISNGHRDKLEGSTLYTTHEPCMMCSYVIRHHKIGSVVYGMAVAHIGGATSDFDLLCTSKVPNWGNGPEIIGGLLQEECRELSEKYNTIYLKP